MSDVNAPRHMLSEPGMLTGLFSVTASTLTKSGRAGQDLVARLKTALAAKDQPAFAAVWHEVMRASTAGDVAANMAHPLVDMPFTAERVAAMARGLEMGERIARR